eukprot:1418838-Amphidinium_carterae.1
MHDWVEVGLWWGDVGSAGLSAGIGSGVASDVEVVRLSGIILQIASMDHVSVTECPWAPHPVLGRTSEERLVQFERSCVEEAVQ